jgi:NAD dependent epimerase/dehydratase family enzyme
LLPPQRIAVTGASGLIGTALVGYLKSQGHTVQRLVRRAAVSSDEITWDPIAGTVDMEALAGVDAVIHLAGAGVSDKRWTKKYKSEILNSRLLGTTTIAKAVAIVKPQVFIFEKRPSFNFIWIFAYYTFNLIFIFFPKNKIKKRYK